MNKTLKHLSCATLLFSALPLQAAVITANNSFAEGYYSIRDSSGNSITGGSGTSFPPGLDAIDFSDSQGGSFSAADFPGTISSPTAGGYGGGDIYSVYDTDHFYGDGGAGTEVTDPGNEFSLIQSSGQSLVDITFEILTDYTYTLTGEMTSTGIGRVDLLFDGIVASETDGIFSYTGYLAAGSYNFSINALAATDIAQKATSGYSYDLQLTAVPAVPVPAAVWLFGSGLIALVGFSRRKTS
jgi:hypothetical protein